MKIVVCLKRVPHPDYFPRLTLDPVTRRVRREGIPSIINPADRNALEFGLQIRERFSGKVTAVTMGPPEAREILEEALATGADEAILLSDAAFGGADTLATAYTLAAAIKNFCPPDIVLCGNETIDSGTAQVGPQLAELLGIPHVSNARTLDFTGEKRLQVERSLETGSMKLRVNLPALVAVARGSNQPRLPTIDGIMRMSQKPLKTYGLADLGVPREKVGLAGSPTRVAELFDIKHERRGEILRGKPEKTARIAVARLRELRII